MERVQLQPGFILHYRPYRNTSMLLDVFTEDQGIVALVARGVRGQRSRVRGLLQPFVPIYVSWSGRGELCTLNTVEPRASITRPAGAGLLSGFYLNELLLRLLHRHDPHKQLFELYQQTLNSLGQPATVEVPLRLFELQLLEELGYGLRLDQEAETGEPLLSDERYRFNPELGFILHQGMVREETLHWYFMGSSLLALHHRQLQGIDILKDAKRLMRLAFAPLLGNKPLKSRELF